MYKVARDEADLSQEIAAEFLNIGTRSLSNYENYKSTTPPDTVLAMSDVYRKPEVRARYCAEVCPIGQVYAHPVETKDLEAAALGLVKEFNDVKLIRDRLICIASDGVIGQDEQPEFGMILGELADLEQKIETLKLWAASKLGHDCMKERRRKEKAPVSLAAENRASYNA